MRLFWLSRFNRVGLYKDGFFFLFFFFFFFLWRAPDDFEEKIEGLLLTDQQGWWPYHQKEWPGYLPVGHSSSRANFCLSCKRSPRFVKKKMYEKWAQAGQWLILLPGKTFLRITGPNFSEWLCLFVTQFFYCRGFVKYSRSKVKYRPAKQRMKDWNEIYYNKGKSELKEQAAR